MAAGIRVAEILGRNVGVERRARGWSQDELGEKMFRYIGKKLTRKAVSVLENGGRALNAEEVVALAFALDIPVARLFRPPVGQELLFSTGWTAPARDLLGPGAMTNDLSDGELARLYALSGIGSQARMVRDAIQSAKQALDSVDMLTEVLEEIPDEAAAKIGKEAP